MNRLARFIQASTLALILCLDVSLAQQSDTSSYFSLGLWGLWIDTSKVPYNGTLTTTQWALERTNWQDIEGNFLVAYTPMWVEDNVIQFCDGNNYKLAVSNSNWNMPSLNANSLMGWLHSGDLSKPDTAITIITDVRNHYTGHDGFHSYFLDDEHSLNDSTRWTGIQFVAQTIHNLDPGRKSLACAWGARPEAFYNATPALDVYQSDVYPFFTDRSSKYSDQQWELDNNLMPDYNNLMNRLRGRYTEWQAIIQSQGEVRGGGDPTPPRRPNLYELRAMTYLALSRGARGITYFVYGSRDYSYPNWGFMGLVDTDPATDTRIRWEDVNPGPIAAFSNVKSVNHEIAPLGPTIRKLRVYDAFPNTAFPRNNVANINGVSGDRIEIGVFRRIDQGADSTVHFMLVNRRCNEEDYSVSSPQSVTVSFNNAAPCGFKDVASGEIWAFPANGSFAVTLDPGKGRLFARMEYQAALMGLAIQGKSVSSAATAYNGQRKLYRESSGKLHEVFASGSINGGEIFYRNSTDNGVSWNNTTRLSDGTVTSLAPCITVGPGPTVIVVWQQASGSNYNVVFSRSVNGGSSWSGISTIQSNFSCASPGPLPSVSDNMNTGSVVVVYRTSSGLRYVYSTSNMASWTGPSTVPNTNGNYNSPTTALYPVASQMADKCNLAFSTNVGYSSQLYYSYYTFSSSSWSAFSSLSSALPGSYQQHKNPSLAVSSTSTTTAHVAWEASLMAPPTPVLVHRKGSSGNFGSQYTVIQYQSAYNPSIAGLTSDNAWMVFQNSSSGGFSKVPYSNSGGSWVWGPVTNLWSGNYAQLSVGSSNAKYLWTAGSSSPYTVAIGTETLSKSVPLAVSYSRELNFIDAKTGSSITLEIKQPQMVHMDGTISPIPFVDAPPDSVVIAAKEILTYGSTQSFTASKDIDSLELQYSVRTINSGNILHNANAALSFDLCDIKTGNILKTIESRTIAKNSDTTSVLRQVNIPAKSIQDLLQGSGVSIRPSVVGMAGDSPDVIASLGHVYRYGAEGGSELPKPMLAEDITPKEYLLEQNYPNPFNPVTQIKYSILGDGYVTLKVFDLLGREVATLAEGAKAGGYYTAVFDGSKLSSGVYFTRLVVRPQDGSKMVLQTRKIVLAK